MSQRPTRTVGRVVVAATVAAVAALSAVTATAAPSRHDPGAGRLLDAKPLRTAAALPSAARTMAITYASDDMNGRPIAVTGTVAIPRGKAPAGGWPVLSWAHGTTGIADVCAPSRDTATGLDHDYLGPVTQVLDSWVRKGYAVAQTDYQGLGAPGVHPYLNGVSEANSVIDIVRAARRLDPAVGRNWAVAGHSQGGQATLFTAQQARQRAPELALRAAVSIAPGGVALDQMVPYMMAGGPGAEAAEAFAPLIVLGAQAADPAVRPQDIFSAAAQPFEQAARAGCIAQIRAVPAIPTAQLFKAGANTGPLTTYLKAQDPITTNPAVPTMVAQGTADTVVAPAGTTAMVAAMCGRGIALDYRTYAGQDHRGSVPASLADAQAFVGSAMAGRATPRTCG
ncbi:alpha/beta hydrolase family protein [Jongsikchunia kroppenstedtii]|uniref:alpha/beta hydrolase family protein n=1 Tax=Jongsikchunia kroppenstedtii TaxID=1121721 RepID=UPI00037A6C42|nr:prolyl oligopeptidase family serine peptidase [Jongsikchunia kroppenstedtii]